MISKRANIVRRLSPFLKLVLAGIIIATIAIGLSLSEITGYKPKRIIKDDFQEIYPDYEAVQYDFEIGKVRTRVDITYLDTDSNECFLSWEYVKWDKIGWINIDNSDAIIIEIE